MIKELAKEMREQDNLATAHPLYCVFEKERIYGIDRNYSDQYELDEDGNKIFLIERDKFVNAHFTMKAAQRFIEENRHNHPTAFVYVSSLYRCHEMIALQDYLKSL